MSRYATMFARLASARHGAFVPFFVLGDPSLETSLTLIEAAIVAGASALEVGIPFSDPIADGPVIQLATNRALAAGATTTRCLKLIAEIRARHPQIPIGILTYANIVRARELDVFYIQCATAGVDSVLVADVPIREKGPFVQAAHDHKIAPVFIAPRDASDATLAAVAAASEGYVYCLARAGVTGTDEDLDLGSGATFAKLRSLNSAPLLLGFGVSKPAHVRAALAAGAQGAISGSAVVKRITENLDNHARMHASIIEFVKSMVAAAAHP